MRSAWGTAQAGRLGDSSSGQPSCCHSHCDSPNLLQWHLGKVGDPSRRTRLLLCCLAFPDLGVLGSPLAASFLPLASGALPALPGEASLCSLTPGFIPR